MVWGDKDAIRACEKCGAPYGTGVTRCLTDGEPVALRAKDPLVGHVLGGYAIHSRIGRGGMAAVYRASAAGEGEAGEQKFAVKVLYGELAANPVTAARFQREAEATRAIQHPNAATSFDSGATASGVVYIAMEYLDGRPLDRVIAEEAPFGFERAAKIAWQLALVLGHAHEKGFVHRDVKPSNVLIIPGPEGEVAKLVDFGLVGIVSDEEKQRLTQAGAILGTPAFMSPEQLKDARVGPVADLYSLGVILHQMISGELPFKGPTAALAFAKMNQDPPPLATTTGLEPLTMRLLARNPDERPQTAQAVMQALARLFTERGLPVPPGAPTAATPPKETPKKGAGLGCATLIAIAAALSVLALRVI